MELKTVSTSPHVKSPRTVHSIMLDVIIALIPSVIAAAYFFGVRVFYISLISVATAVLSEAMCRLIMKREQSIGDLSAVVTGLIIGMNMPVSAPLWMPVIGSSFAIVIVKQFFGGIGCNFVNPALAARAFLLASWPVQMTSWVLPSAGFAAATDAVTSATPLVTLSHNPAAMPSLMDLFIGRVPGCIGEVSVAALLIGAIYLSIRRIIDLRIPLCYIGTTVLIMCLFNINNLTVEYALDCALAGGLIFGAFFMATDYVTTPVTTWGRVIFGVGAGIITAVIRLWGGYPEGVTYAILLMNIATPLVERATHPHTYGYEKKRLFAKKRNKKEASA